MTSDETQSSRLGQRLLKLLGGAAAGFLGIALFFGSGLGKSIALLGPGPLVLAGSGLIYMVMALIVGLGALFPAAGVKILNVADREDLEEQRKTLLRSSLSSILLAAFQISLAASGPAAPVWQTITLVVIVITLAGTLGIEIAQWRRTDELMRQVSWESAGVVLIVLWLVLGGWAATSVFGAAPRLDPHGVIAVLFLSLLAGIFIAAGRRGLLEQG